MSLFKAWLVAGPISVQAVGPFGKRRRDISVNAGLLEPWLDLQEAKTADAVAQHVLGVALCRASFIYDCGCILTRAQNAQRVHWQHMGVRDRDLWFFEVQQVALFSEPLPCKQFTQDSKSKVYEVFSQDVASELGLYLQDAGRPDWLQDDPRLALKFPPRIASLVMKGTWRSVCLPSPFVRGPWHVAEWKLDMMGHSFARAFQGLQARAPAVSRQNFGMFSLEDCQNLADDIRALLSQMPEDKQADLIPWVKQLQSTSDNLSLPRVISEKFHRMIDFVFLCELLHDVADAREAVRRSVKLTLPEALQDAADKHLKQQRLFDKSEVSRFRVVFDVAFMLWQRAVAWSAQTLQKQTAARYLMWDSSPQFSGDYEMIRVVSVPESDFPFMHNTLEKLATMWLQNTELMENLDLPRLDDAEANKEEVLLMEKVRAVLQPHVLPAVLLGFGATSLNHKFHALCHAMRLEQFSADALHAYCKELVSVTSDFGVEHLLAQAERIPVSVACQFFTDDADLVQHVLKLAPCSKGVPLETAFEDPSEASGILDLMLPASRPGVHLDEFESNLGDAVELEIGSHADCLESPDGEPIPLHVAEAPDPDQPQAEIFEEVPDAPCVDFRDMLSFPGVHHVLDNAVNGMSGSMDHYDELITQAAKLCKFLRNAETRDILVERCFGNPVGLQFRQSIREFKGNIYPGRWGTIAFSVPHLRNLERPLRWGWDKQRYLQDANARRASVTAIVEEVDKAITSSFFWAWLRVLEMLVRAIRRTTAWSEGCPCHWPLLQQARLQDLAIPAHVRKRWAKCPFRGLRAPELCNGEFLQVASNICESCAVDLLQGLPADISREDRTALLQEFDAGRAHLCFYLALKLTALEEWPWKLCVLAHPYVDLAHVVLREALASTHSDTRLSALQGPLRPLCVRWLAGESLLGDGMQPLLKLIASLRFIPINERPAEALHRQTKLHGRSRPCHSVGLMSLKQRMPEIKALLELMPHAVHDLAALCHHVRNNWLSVCAVGLQTHPTLNGLRAARNSHRNPLMAQVIYHADAHTLYSIPVPEVPMRPDAPGPGRDAGDGREGRDSPHGEDDDDADVAEADDDGDSCGDSSSSSAPSSPRSQGASRHQPPAAGLEALLQRQTGESKVLLHALMLNRLCSVLQNSAKQFLSLPFPAKAMRTLASALKMPSQPAYRAGSDVNLDAELNIQPSKGRDLPIEATLSQKKQLTAAARALMFFRVVRASPHLLKRNKVAGEVGFQASDVVVAPHRLCRLEPKKRQVAVDATSLQLPQVHESMASNTVIISFAALDCEQLAQSRAWEVSGPLQCFMKPDLLPESEKWPQKWQEAAGPLLCELVETSAGVQETFWRLVAERKEILKVLESHGWVQQHEAAVENPEFLGPWVLHA